MSAPKQQRCGIETSSARETIISSFRTMVWKRIILCCRSSSSLHGRPAFPWQPPTTPTICARRMPKCRASCSASRPARPFRMRIKWSSRPTSSMSKRQTKCTSCSPWCRKPARIPPKLPNSVTLILILDTLKFHITKRRTVWIIRRFLKSSAGKVWSAATAPMFRRPTKTVWNTRSAWSKRWATRTTILSCGTT